MENYKNQIIKTNGINLNVVQTGAEDGPLVILLHGFPEFWYGWRHQIDALVTLGLRVWVPDQRGYNLSDKPEGVKAYRVDEMVKDVIGLIDAAGVEKAIIIGHDWGAMITWWTALFYPERLEKIVIMNVPHPEAFNDAFKSFSLEQITKSWYAMFFQFPLMPEAVLRMGNWQMMARGIQQSAQKGSFTDADMNAYRNAWSKPGAMTAMLNWYRAYVQHPVQPPNGWQVHVPTLMIWGAKDFALSQKMTQPSIAFCDEGTLHIIKEATHWVQHDASEQVNQLLREYLI